MKATGIVRRMDDLGRVVIPKEIRKTMKLQEGDPLELFLDKGGIVFKRYSPIDEEMWDTALAAACALCGEQVVLLDRDYERMCGSLEDYKDWTCIEIQEAFGHKALAYISVNKPLESIEVQHAVSVVKTLFNR